MKTKPEDVSDAVVPISLAALALSMLLFGIAAGNMMTRMANEMVVMTLASPVVVMMAWGVVMYLCVRKANASKSKAPPLEAEDVGAAICKRIGEPITFQVTLLPKAREVMMRLAVKRGIDTPEELYKQAMTEYLERHWN